MTDAQFYVVFGPVLAVASMALITFITITY